MNILFVHNAFPAQFLYLAPALIKLGHRVIAITATELNPDQKGGVELILYETERGNTPGIHPWILDIESKIIRAQSCFNKAISLKKNGFSPDIIIAHHAWGESLFLKEVWPNARMGIYCEFFLGVNTGFDPEFEPEDPCFTQLQNINNLLHFELADAAISPTQWQASTFPEPFRSKISIIHDGIDTEVVVPNPDVSVSINNKISLCKKDEVITFVNRNLEPYRGFHVFLRALPEILKRRSNARILIVGGFDFGYGPISDSGEKWKTIFVNEIRPQISDTDWSRVHFLGQIPYSHFISLLQLSTVHVYLTYPFVLSWSLLEAMSAGCAIVASNTQPVREVIKHRETGELVDFFDISALADEVCKLLHDPESRERLGRNAREFVKTYYDLKTNCLPKQIEWVDQLGSM